MSRVLLLLAIFWQIVALSTPTSAQKQPSEEDLVKQTQNPVADLISVPLQNNLTSAPDQKTGLSM
jgi:hypothetical protein